MNPADEADFRAVFGDAKLPAASRPRSDRWAEGWARRRGSTIPDMRRGAHKSTAAVDPLDPSGESDRPRAAVSGLDAAQFPAKRKLQAPRVPTGRVRGGVTVALTLEEFTAELAKIDAAAVPARPPAPEPQTLRLPIDGEALPRHRSTLEAVRRFAVQTQKRHPRPASELADDESAADEIIAGYGRVPWWTPEWATDEELAEFPADQDAEYDFGPLPEYDDLEDVPLWALDEYGRPFDWWLAEQAEEEAAHAEYLRQLMVSPAESRARTGDWLGPSDFLHEHRAAVVDGQDSAEPRCTHCGVDPIQTTRDGLCRWCKRWRTTHQGQLPDDRAIRRRRDRKVF